MGESQSSLSAQKNEHVGVGISSSPRETPMFWWLCFGLILLAGGFLRFWRLGHQSIWCDESATAMRVSGSMHALIKSLDRQGFPPGWYVLLLGWRHMLESLFGLPKWLAMSVTALRVLPAILGTLLVPVAYWLGRQWFDRRGALLVMLLAAVNPFLGYYSRDLKMYSACYFTIALNMALFFQWLRTRRVWPWGWLLLASALAMTAIDFLSWMIIPAQLAALLLRPREKWRRPDVPLWLATVCLMGGLTAGWYYRFSNFAKVTVGHDSAGPVGWVGLYNQMDWHTFAGLPTVHLLGFLWPVYPPTPRMLNWLGLSPGFNEHLATRSIPWLAHLELALAAILFAVLILGLVPWQRLLSPEHTIRAEAEADERPGRWWHVAIWLGLPLIFFGLGSLPKSSPWSLYPHFVMWQQRYLGPLVMAWVLWLVAALVRLPGWWLRASLASLFVLVMLGFSLTSHLLCRQEPWNFIYPTALKFFNPKTPDGMRLVCARPSHPFGDQTYAMLTALHQTPKQLKGSDMFPRPGNVATVPLPPVILLPSIAGLWESQIAEASQDRALKSLVLADRWGDIKTGPLSIRAISARLGSGWRLVQECRFRWYYQWWFYFYSPWRVRVWQRVAGVPPGTAPATLHRPLSLRPK